MVLVGFVECNLQWCGVGGDGGVVMVALARWVW